MSVAGRKKLARRSRALGGRESPELSPEIKEVLNMLRALEDQPAEDAGPGETGKLGRSVITD